MNYTKKVAACRASTEKVQISPRFAPTVSTCWLHMHISDDIIGVQSPTALISKKDDAAIHKKILHVKIYRESTHRNKKQYTCVS